MKSQVPNITFVVNYRYWLVFKTCFADVNSEGIGFDINSLKNDINKTLAVMFHHITFPDVIIIQNYLV